MNPKIRPSMTDIMSKEISFGKIADIWNWQERDICRAPDRLRLRIDLHLRIASYSLVWDPGSTCWARGSIPNSTSWGARNRICGRVRRGTALFTLRFLRFGHLATRLMRSSKFTAPLRLPKFREMSEVKLSGKLLSHWPLSFPTSLSCKSKCSRNLHF